MVLKVQLVKTPEKFVDEAKQHNKPSMQIHFIKAYGVIYYHQTHHQSGADCAEQDRLQQQRN